VVQEFGGRARFVSENYGESELAKRFGVRRYPAIFVGDALVATPKDFGFYGKGEGQGDGRYTPWRSAASHERFRADLHGMIARALAHERPLAARADARDTTAARGMPRLTLGTLDGGSIAFGADTPGRVTLVEFWATWCPPCRGTLRWLGDLKRRYGDRLTVVTIAIESDDADVQRVSGELALPLRWAIGTPDVARAFGDVSAVPTLLLYDPDGRAVASAFGAPPTLHADIEGRLDALLGRP
jgi:thiol-disulfide isomerase/thioredoxin